MTAERVRAVRSDPALRDFVVEHTALRPVALVPEIAIHTATEVTPLWHATEAWLRERLPGSTRIEGSIPIPFWSVPWAGGAALARFVLDRPETVRGLRVLDFACGSGLVAIAAMRAGAREVVAADIDPLALEATRLNAATNHVTLDVRGGDLVGTPLSDFDVVLAGDVFYEREASARFVAWFETLAARGVRVLAGHPDRQHVKAPGHEIACYEVPTSEDLESVPTRTTRIVSFDGPSAPAAMAP